MRDQPIDMPFPFKGLDEYRSFSEQSAGTSPDLLNVMGVDPATGRLRGAQRPGLSRYVDEGDDEGDDEDDAPGTPIQDIIHMIGPDFGPAGGPSQQMVNNPEGASWGLLNRSGQIYQEGGPSGQHFRMGCWDSLGHFYVATRLTNTSDEIVIDRYDVNGSYVGFLDPAMQTTLKNVIDAESTSVEVVDETVLPTAPFYIKVDDEYMYVSSVDNKILTVSRAPDGSVTDVEATGTTAAAHNAGATVQVAKKLSVYTGNFTSTSNPLAGMTVRGSILYLLINGTHQHEGRSAPYTVSPQNITSVSGTQITKAGSAWPKNAVGSTLAYQGSDSTTLKTVTIEKRVSDTVLQATATAPALGVFATTLNQGSLLSAEAEEITVTNGSVFEDVSAPFTIKIENEEIRVASRDGHVLTVETDGRGANGTSAATHAHTDPRLNVTFVSDNWTLTAPTDADPRHMIARYQTATGVCIDGSVAEGQPKPFAQSSTVAGSGDDKGQIDGTLFSVSGKGYNYLASASQYLAVPTEDTLLNKSYTNSTESAEVVVAAGAQTIVRLKKEEDGASTNPIWPYWIADAARTGIEIKIPAHGEDGSTAYTIASRDSDTQITLTGSAATTDGSTFSVTAINRKRFLLNIIDIGSGNRHSYPTVLEANDAAQSADTLICTGIEDDGVNGFFVAGQIKDNDDNNDTAGGSTVYKNFLHYRTHTGAAADSNWGTAGLTDTSSDGYPTGIAYSAYNDHVAVAGSNVFGTGKALAIYQANTVSGVVDGKVPLHKSDPVTEANGTAVTTWARVFADAQGNYRLSRNNSGESPKLHNVISISNPSGSMDTVPTVLWSYGADTDDQDQPIDINTVHTRFPSTVTTRLSRLLFVRGGDVYRVDAGEGTGKSANKVTQTLNAGDNTPFNSAAPRIFSAEIYPNIFFTDGGISSVAAGSYYYDSATNTLSSWVASPGTFPVDSNSFRPSLICAWQARIVLSGVQGDPHNWFMSAINDPFDFDYAPASVCETMAVAGSSSNAGKTQDIINALAPWSNDVLLFGMDHSLAQMSGNPAAGGRFDTLTDITGMAYGRPFSMHPDRSMWFIGSRGGLYRLTPGQRNPERVSATTIDDRLSQIDFSKTIVRMQWDDRLQGFLIVFTDADGGESTHYFFDMRNLAWYPWKFAKDEFNPHSIHLFDGDKVDDRVILAGSRDGYLRFLDYESKHDDKTDAGSLAAAKTINSHVLIGPIQGPGQIPLVLTGLSSVLGANSDSVNYSIHVGDSPEEALAASSIGGGTFRQGRNTWDRRRTSGTALYIKLSNDTLGESWSLERLYGTIRGSGRTFEKAH